METDGQEFLEELAGFPPKSFESNFSRIAERLELGRDLAREELDLLFWAAFGATLCNIAFNGLGGCGGIIRPEREANRTNLEREFMVARDEFYASDGWRSLTGPQRASIQQIFLSVSVNPDNLAW